MGILLMHSFWGALLGYIVGGFFDMSVTVGKVVQNGARVYEASIGGGRNGFLYSLMVLSAHVIHADGKIMHSEMETMRRFLASNFGEETKRQGEQIILDLFKRKKAMSPYEWQNYIQQSAAQMALALTPEQRLQLLHYLLDVARADSNLSQPELQALREVAMLLRLNPNVIDQMMGLGKDTLEDAYRVLGISPNATDDEVRRAYKKMALENHPDRVAMLGDDVKKAAEKKFKEINDAKERIYKSRGM